MIPHNMLMNSLCRPLSRRRCACTPRMETPCMRHRRAMSLSLVTRSKTNSVLHACARAIRDSHVAIVSLVTPWPVFVAQSAGPVELLLVALERRLVEERSTACWAKDCVFVWTEVYCHVSVGVPVSTDGANFGKGGIDGQWEIAPEKPDGTRFVSVAWPLKKPDCTRLLF
jgi:hypothetical protein